MARLPDIKNYTTPEGAHLRTLYAVAVLRALTPRERQDVLAVIGNPS